VAHPARRRRLKILVAALTLLASFAAGAADPQVEMKTSLGTIVIELDPGKAPATVQNFVQYVKERHYDGTLFHRVIPGFMIQGGGFDADFKQKPTRAPIKNEAANGLKNDVGTIAMARTADPHSATAQFFINVADNASLNFRFPTPEGYGYTVFGKVTKGMDVVQRIVKVRTGPGPAPHRDVPVKPVVIESVRLIEARPAAGK
jgi:peptidyl-prolyl cis-trans isomerase A (cyclophilin A)/peptidyl-prolyl cis-trans isomerase B (cyclophilin B)